LRDMPKQSEFSKIAYSPNVSNVHSAPNA
jgi:hypothetical protein